MTRVPLDPEAQRLIETLAELLPPGDPPATLVTVWATSGSVPRARGARLLCRGGRLLAGTIGGGHLEGRAIARAAALQAEAEARGRPLAGPLVERFALGPELAQCCGGTVELLYEGVDARGAQRRTEALRRAREEGTPLRTRCGSAELVEEVDSLPSVLIFGAGHVGTALARVLSVLPWRVTLVDGRPERLDPAGLPAGMGTICAPPLQLLAAWGWMGAAAAGSRTARALDAEPPPPGPLQAALIMTHDHDLDREIAAVLLQLPEVADRPALAYTGLIGSRTKIATMRRRLSGRGLSDTQLDRLSAPIGLRVGGRAIGGKRPGEIAISAAAELLRRFCPPPAAGRG